MATSFDRTRQVVGAVRRGDYDDNQNALAQIVAAFNFRSHLLRNMELIESGDQIVVDGLGQHLDGLTGTAKIRRKGDVTILLDTPYDFEGEGDMIEHFSTCVGYVRLIAKYNLVADTDAA